MKKKRVIQLLKKLHKWPAIIIAFFAILFAISGIVMNHRQFFSPIDVSHKLLPSNYTIKNWNRAAIRGSIDINEYSKLIYGNIGVWQTSDDFNSFEDFNIGFPNGIDNRKIYSIVKFNNTLFAGTHLGLYKLPGLAGEWQKVNLPVEKNRIADIGIKGDQLLVLTRNYLLTSADGDSFNKIQLPEPLGYERKIGMFNTLWELHSGELFGFVGKLAVDLLGIVTIFLAVSGLFHFFSPKIIRRRKKREKQVASLVSFKKKNLRWHNVVGYIFILFLIVNTIAGMFLRPPLLIPIANAKVGIIPFTHLDSPNPWFDKLRRVEWNESSKQYIFSTSEGMFYAEETLKQLLVPAPSQPPVSIMGCNVLESIDNQTYLVGSFSGMFLWDIKTGAVYDYFTRQPHTAMQTMSRPISANMVTGLVKGKESSFWFDFSGGAIGLTDHEFPEMTEEIIKSSPMSLWNVALEIHTGRIFENILGPFYILFVPLAGICVLLVLISGFFMWWLVYKKK